MGCAYVGSWDSQAHLASTCGLHGTSRHWRTLTDHQSKLRDRHAEAYVKQPLMHPDSPQAVCDTTAFLIRTAPSPITPLSAPMQHLRLPCFARVTG